MKSTIIDQHVVIFSPIPTIYSYPLEHERVHALNGFGSFVAKILVVERERPGRISVLLVKEALGF